MSTEWQLDTDRVERRLARFEGIDQETILALEAALITVFNATQNATHVITGNLRRSGRMDSTSDEDSWEGTITYGGPGTGVDYAAIENARGGSHAYMEIANHLDHVIGVAFRTGLDE